MNERQELADAAAVVAPILEIRGVAKRFDATQALEDVSLALRAGEIHALLGENGAGKSTLIKIITGVHQPDRGQILLAGRPVTIRSAAEAQRLGVAAIYQEPLLFPDLNVAENIFISHQDRGAVVGWRDMFREADKILAELGITLDVRKPARGLTLAAQQSVEIAKAISLNVRVLIMDEPTASLSAHEVQELFKLVRDLKQQGVAILFVSHRMEEVFEIADKITVFRDGRLISTRTRLEATPQRAIADMVGREIDLTKARTTCARKEVVLSVADLGRQGVFEGVSFDLHRGEVLGFAGLIGAGRTDVGLALFGIEPATSGTILVGGNPVIVRTAREGMDLGIAYVSEDRRQLGLVLPMSIFANITLPILRRYLNRLGLVRTGLERRTADAFRERLAIRTPSVDLEVAKLSGGNQQKVMLSKWLNTNPSVLILDEPTRGVDVGSKAEVHAIIGQLAAEGIGVIVISSDLPEVLVLSDRVLVMREGRQMAILNRAEANEETVMTAAMGQRSTDTIAWKADMNWLKRRVRPEQIRELSLLVLILAAIVFFGSFIDNYYSFRTFNRIASSVAIITVVAVGQTLVVLTRNIDLSVGSIVGFTAYFVGTLIANHNGINPILAVAIAIALGAALGVVNGVIVAWGKVPAVVVTLGTLAIYRGVLVDLSGAKTVTTDSLPQWLIDLPLVNVAPIGGLDIRALFMLALVIVVVFQIGTTYLSFARRFYAIGSNPEAAQLIGLPIKGVVFLAFVICGALSGLAGFMLLARFGNITVEAGRGLELSVVAAVVVGGVNVFGGSGTVTGAMLGAVMIGTLEQSLFRLGISEFWLDAVLGLLILLAVASDAVILQRLRQLWGGAELRLVGEGNRF